jgi:hypothetical protein
MGSQSGLKTETAEQKYGKDGWIETFNGLLLDERGAWLDNQASLTAKALATRRETLRSAVKEIGKTGDIALILATEKTILVTDSPFTPTVRRWSPASAPRLPNSRPPWPPPKVADPALYRAVDEAHSLPRTGSGPSPGMRRAVLPLP